jgi:hypothetical protein
MCEESRSFDRGLGVIHEYAGLQDLIMESMEHTTSLIDSCIACITAGRTEAAGAQLTQLAHAQMRLYFNLCNWRKLQACPRPFFVKQPRRQGTPSSSGNCDNVPVQSIVKRNTNLLIEAAAKANFKLTECGVSMHHLCLLLSPELDEANLGVFLHAQGSDSFSATTDVTRQVIGTVHRVLAMEGMVESTWRAFNSVLHAPMTNPYDDLPMLRLPYRGVQLPTNDLAWFDDAVADYRTCSDICNYYLELFDSELAHEQVVVDEGMNRMGSHESVVNDLPSSNQTRNSADQKRRSLSFNAAADRTGGIATIVDSPARANGGRSSSFSMATPSGLITPTNIGAVMALGSMTPSEMIKQLSHDDGFEDDDSADNSKGGNFDDDVDAFVAKSQEVKKVVKKATGKVNRPKAGGKAGASTVWMPRVERDKAADQNRGGSGGSKQSKQRVVTPTKKPNSANSTGSGKKRGGSPLRKRSPMVRKTSPSGRPTSGRPMSATPPNSAKARRAKGPSRDSELNSIPSHTVNFSVDVAGEGGIGGDDDDDYYDGTMALSPNLDRLRSPGARPMSATSQSVMQTNRFRSRSMESLHTMSMLTSSNTRSEAKMEGQTVYIALREINVDGLTMVTLAVRKIETWWYLVYPRKQLMKRMAAKSLVLGILDTMISVAAIKGEHSLRIRSKLLQLAAANIIQKKWRLFQLNYMSHVKAIQKQWRVALLRRRFRYVLVVTRAAIRVFRWIVRWNRLHNHHQRTPLQCRKFVSNFFNLIGDAKRGLDAQRTKLRLMRDHAALQSLTGKGNSSTVSKYGASRSSQKRLVIKKLIETAATSLQRAYRRYVVAKEYLTKLTEERIKKNISENVYRLMLASKSRQRFFQRVAAKHLQRHVRGYLCRSWLYARVRASIVIIAAWRRYKSSNSLRRNLRRVDRPTTVTFGALMGDLDQFIPKNMNSDLRVKLSVWWHPLLHVVSQGDFITIMQNKAPQFVHYVDAIDSEAEDASTSSSLIPSGVNTILKTVREGTGSIMSGMSGGALGRALKPKSSLGAKANKLDFGNQKVLIPGCHGNSVFRFEFMTGERKFASSIAFLGVHGSLMFWDKNFSEPITIIQSRRGLRVGHSMSSSSGRDRHAAVAGAAKFDFRIRSGEPLRSRSGWCVVNFKGSGPGWRKHRGLLGSLFDTWQKMYISMDGQVLHFFASKSISESSFTVSMSDVVGVRVELGAPIPQRYGGGRYADDTHNIIITSIFGDVIYLRLPNLKNRELWWGVFQQCENTFNNPSNRRNMMPLFSSLSFKMPYLTSSQSDPGINSVR